MSAAVAHIIQPGLLPYRQKEIVVQISPSVKIEVRRRHAHYRMAGAVELNRPADQMRIAVEMPLPNPMAENHQSLAAELVFVFCEGAPERGLRAERGEKIRRHVLPNETLRLANAGQYHAVRYIPRDVFKDRLL